MQMGFSGVLSPPVADEAIVFFVFIHLDGVERLLDLLRPCQQEFAKSLQPTIHPFLWDRHTGTVVKHQEEHFTAITRMVGSVSRGTYNILAVVRVNTTYGVMIKEKASLFTGFSSRTQTLVNHGVLQSTNMAQTKCQVPLILGKDGTWINSPMETIKFVLDT